MGMFGESEKNIDQVAFRRVSLMARAMVRPFCMDPVFLAINIEFGDQRLTVMDLANSLEARQNNMKKLSKRDYDRLEEQDMWDFVWGTLLTIGLLYRHGQRTLWNGIEEVGELPKGSALKECVMSELRKHESGKSSVRTVMTHIRI